MKFTVLDALQLGYKVNVITDGCRGVNIQPQDSAQRVYGDVSSWGNAIYAGRLGRDAGVILRWPTILYWHCRPNKTRQWHIWQLMPSTKDLIHLRNLFQRHLPRFDAKNGENQRTEQ